MAFSVLLCAFILVPIIEITVLIKVGSALGVGMTILIVIFTAILGAYLVRQQGLATVFAVQQELNDGRVPAMKMAEGIMLLFAGALLLTPGFVTDAFGFALLTPVFRRAAISWIASKGMFAVQTYQTDTTSAAPRADKSSTIEGEYSERE